METTTIHQLHLPWLIDLLEQWEWKNFVRACSVQIKTDFGNTKTDQTMLVIT